MDDGPRGTILAVAIASALVALLSACVRLLVLAFSALLSVVHMA